LAAGPSGRHGAELPFTTWFAWDRIGLSSEARSPPPLEQIANARGRVMSVSNHGPVPPTLVNSRMYGGSR